MFLLKKIDLKQKSRQTGGGTMQQTEKSGK
jgi:hypothetical protein